jgi:hypothetical protein
VAVTAWWKKWNEDEGSLRRIENDRLLEFTVDNETRLAFAWTAAVQLPLTPLCINPWFRPSRPILGIPPRRIMHMAESVCQLLSPLSDFCRLLAGLAPRAGAWWQRHHPLEEESVVAVGRNDKRP